MSKKKKKQKQMSQPQQQQPDLAVKREQKQLPQEKQQPAKQVRVSKGRPIDPRVIPLENRIKWWLYRHDVIEFGESDRIARFVAAVLFFSPIALTLILIFLWWVSKVFNEFLQ